MLPFELKNRTVTQSATDETSLKNKPEKHFDDEKAFLAMDCMQPPRTARLS
jgi:hypothetical protein